MVHSSQSSQEVFVCMLSIALKMLTISPYFEPLNLPISEHIRHFVTMSYHNDRKFKFKGRLIETRNRN